MAHEITIREDGFAEAAFGSNKPAWHGLGQVVAGAMSSAEAIELAGLDWNVVQRSLGYKAPKTIDTDEGPVETHEFCGVDLLANVREDNQLFLGVVSERYKVIQNHEAFAFMDKLAEDGELAYETAFSLNGGKSVVITAQLPTVDTIADDDNQLRFVLMSLSHDGTGAIRFGATSVRCVCANTYGLALKKDGKTIRELSIAHTGKIESKLTEARQILQSANERFDNYAEAAARLAEAKLTRDQWEAFLNIMCPIPHKLDPDWTVRRERSIIETRSAIESNYRNERQSFGDIGETAWAAFNAVTEHIDHLPRRGASDRRKAEARFNVTQYGPGRDQKERAFVTACRISGLPTTVAAA